ncbi:hypothetical protein [Ktedonospora formicarum]|uniref:hypothetical protein n=1 Tax=Ktedonospora formicarum TaxID=2778364 RepID=UPI001C688B14|nr:hypothetical protein [Ktedonospora formicarum]
MSTTQETCFNPRVSTDELRLSLTSEVVTYLPQHPQDVWASEVPEIVNPDRARHLLGFKRVLPAPAFDLNDGDRVT